MKASELRSMKDKARKEYEAWAERNAKVTDAMTHKDVLLKTWAQDTEAMAIFLTMLSQDEDGSFYFKTIRTDCDQQIEGYEKSQSLQDSINGWIAYLNGAAEVGK